MILFELIKYIISIDITQEIKKILSESSSFLKKPLDKINNIKNEKKDIMINKLIFFFSINLSNFKFIQLRDFFS